MKELGEAVGAVTGFAAVIFASAALGAWPVMLALGNLHNDVSNRVPALGLWSVLAINWGLGVVATTIRGHRRSRRS